MVNITIYYFINLALLLQFNPLRPEFIIVIFIHHKLDL